MKGMQDFTFFWWVVVLAMLVTAVPGEESAQYLQNVVRDLKKLNPRPTVKRADSSLSMATTTEAPKKGTSDRRVQKNYVPPLSLTKGELAALYESAIAKGETIKLDAGDNSYVHAAVHEIDGAETQNHETFHGHEGPAAITAPSAAGGPADQAAGYYYYYYPIKSFLDEITSIKEPEAPYQQPSAHSEVVHEATIKPQYQYHSHHHHHSVDFKTPTAPADKKKGLEPLFMAISGFIGMALVMMFSMLVMPKFLKKNKEFKSKNDDQFGDMARIALQAIESGACAERFACELGQTARNFNLQENRFVKLFKRMAPSAFKKQIDKVGRYSNRHVKCTAIPCKKKTSNNNNNLNSNFKSNSNNNFNNNNNMNPYNFNNNNNMNPNNFNHNNNNLFNNNLNNNNMNYMNPNYNNYNDYNNFNNDNNNFNNFNNYNNNNNFRNNNNNSFRNNNNNNNLKNNNTNNNTQRNKNQKTNKNNNKSNNAQKKKPQQKKS